MSKDHEVKIPKFLPNTHYEAQSSFSLNILYHWSCLWQLHYHSKKWCARKATLNRKMDSVI